MHSDKHDLREVQKGKTSLGIEYMVYTGYEEDRILIALRVGRETVQSWKIKELTKLLVAQHPGVTDEGGVGAMALRDQFGHPAMRGLAEGSVISVEQSQLELVLRDILRYPQTAPSTSSVPERVGIAIA